MIGDWKRQAMKGLISVFSGKAEASARLVDLVEDEQQILERARQPIEFPNGEHVAGSEPIKHMVQFGPIPGAAGEAFLIDALAASGLKRLDRLCCKLWCRPSG